MSIEEAFKHAIVTGFGMAQAKQEGDAVRYDFGYTDPREAFLNPTLNKNPKSYLAVEGVLMFNGAEIDVNNWRGAELIGLDFGEIASRQKCVRMLSRNGSDVVTFNMPRDTPATMLADLAHDAMTRLNAVRVLP